MIFFFFNDTATTEIYTLSLHDALPIYGGPPRPTRAPLPAPAPTPARARRAHRSAGDPKGSAVVGAQHAAPLLATRSEEHTSELQSRLHLVCRLLLEKKKNTKRTIATPG